MGKAIAIQKKLRKICDGSFEVIQISKLPINKQNLVEQDLYNINKIFGNKISITSKKIKKHTKKNNTKKNKNEHRQNSQGQGKTQKMNQQDVYGNNSSIRDRDRENGRDRENDGDRDQIYDGIDDFGNDNNENGDGDDSDNNQEDNATQRKENPRKNSVKKMSNFLRSKLKYFGFYEQIILLQKDGENKNKNYRGSTRYLPTSLLILKYKKPKKNIDEYDFERILKEYINHLNKESEEKKAKKAELQRQLQKPQVSREQKVKIERKIKNITNLINQYPIAQSAVLKFGSGDQLGCIVQFCGENKEKTYLQRTIRYYLNWKKKLQAIELPIQSVYELMTLEELKCLMGNCKRKDQQSFISPIPKKDDDQWLDDLLDLQ